MSTDKLKGVSMSDLTVTVAENGRVVLPLALRRRLNVTRGGTVVIREEDGRLLLERRRRRDRPRASPGPEVCS